MNIQHPLISFELHLIIIIIEGLSLLQSIPPTTADKQTQAQKRRGSRSRKLLGAKAKSYISHLKQTKHLSLQLPVCTPHSRRPTFGFG